MDGIPTPAQPKVEFAAIEKVFTSRSARVADTRALDSFSLKMAPGEIISIVGPTGCGKSTALNILAGFELPSRGAVHVDGEAVMGPGPNRGVVFQQASLFPWLTGTRECRSGCEVPRRSPRRVRAASLAVA